MASLIDDIFAQTNGKKDNKAAASNGELKTKKAPSEISSSITPSADKKKKKKRKVEDAEPQQQQQQEQEGDASSKSKKAKLKGKARQTEPETILDPSAPRPTATTTTQTASSSSSTSQRTEGRAFEAAVDEDDLAFADSRGSARKRTEEGFPIYSESELKIGQGGGTPLCPFDCDCCF